MKTLTKSEARHLIGRKEAGWYAIGANPPIPHDKQMVVQVRDQYYLVPAEQAQVKFMCVTEMPGAGGSKVPKQIHSVMLDGEIEKLIREEMKDCVPIDVGADLPTYYGGKLSPP